MAGEVAITALLDLAATTLAKYPEDKYRNMLIEQKYIFKKLFGEWKPKAATGTKVVYDAMLKGGSSDTGDAADGGPGRYGSYETLGNTATEYLEQGEVPWCYYQTYWTISEQEIRHNSGREGFIKIQKVKREGCVTRLANILEKDFWSASSYAYESSAKPMILGPEYWITDDGYHVNDSGGGSGTQVGGINPASSDFDDAQGVNRWRNQFEDQPSANALIDSYDEMFIECKYEAPPTVEMNTTPQYSKYHIIGDITTFKLYKKLQKRLRDNVGSDLSSGRMVFNNIIIEMADRMAARSDSTYQTFFINSSTWNAYVDTENHMKKDKVKEPDNQHARFQRIWFWPTIDCEDRRLNGKVFGYPADITE